MSGVLRGPRQFRFTVAGSIGECALTDAEVQLILIVYKRLCEGLMGLTMGAVGATAPFAAQEIEIGGGGLQ